MDCQSVLARRAARPGRAWIGPLIFLLGALSAGAARAGVQIDEVMPGAFLHPEVQFVELRFSCFDNDWDGKRRLTFYDADGDETGEYIFPTDPPAESCNPTSVLVGTQAFADLASTPEPDYILPPDLLASGSGKVCFDTFPNSSFLRVCLSYGDFTGDSEQGSPGNAPPLSGAGICALQRDVLFNDFGTPGFNEDFRLLPPEPTNTAGETGTVAFPPRFADVPPSSPFLPFVEALARAGVTGGCGNGSFCPKAVVSRDQMAVFLLLAKHGAAFQPPACAAPVFGDVPCSNPFAAWINQLAAEGITGGCGGGNYCPGGLVSREQMAVFLLLAKEGSAFTPPACTSQAFGDVPCTSPFAPWVNELAGRGITGGCGGGAFCPGNTVTREQMAVFLSTTFGLPVPSLGCPAVPVDDDHGNTPVTATLLSPPVTLPGQLERRADVDYFALDAVAGQRFLFEGTRLQPDTGSFASELDLALFDVDGVVQIRTGQAPFNGPTVLGFTAPSTGRFFLRASSDFKARGSYQITSTGPLGDDHGDTPATSTPIGVGAAPTSGQIEIPEDVEVFGFDATAGQLYAVTLTWTAPSPPFGFSVQILGGDGFGLSLPSLGTDRSRVLYLRPFQTGRYFARVTATSTARGPYQIQVAAVFDDHGDTPGSATPLVPGVSQNALVLPDDTDFFSFQAVAGQFFWVEVSENGDCPMQILSLNGSTAFPGVTMTAPATGTFFVRLRQTSFSSQVGQCQVTLHGPIVDDHGNTAVTATPLTPGSGPVAGRLDYPGDVDVFSFEAQAGQIIPLSWTGETPNAVIVSTLGNATTIDFEDEPPTHWLLVQQTGRVVFEVRPWFDQPRTGSYQVNLGLPVAVPDDHGNVPALATRVTLGAPAIPSALEFENDRDVFAFDAVAGQTYGIKVFPTKFFRPLIALYLPDLTPRGTATASFFFTAEVTGRHYFSVQIWDDFHQALPWTYEVAVSAPPPDDHGNTPETATLITVDGPAVAGNNESWFEWDVFAFDAAAGEPLIVETANIGTLTDTGLVIFGPDGKTVLGFDDDGGGALGARVAFTPATAGRYYAGVSQAGLGVGGPYRISVRRAP